MGRQQKKWRSFDALQELFPNASASSGAGQRRQRRDPPRLRPKARIYAPYNFVPLPRKVFVPDWAEQVSHDKPFRDGVSGTLYIAFEAKTPILVGGRQQPATHDHPAQVHFCRAPDGRYMIPGSTLRGAIRAVLEIVAFGRMRFVDDRAMSLRDLAGALKSVYREKMRPDRVQAGWLQLQNGKWTITPCSFLRVSHEELARFAQKQGAGLDENALGKRNPSPKKRYEIWQRHGLPLAVRFEKKGGKAVALGQGNQGRIVFTGQPGPKKKHDFIFYDERPEDALTLDARSVRDFQQVYGDRDNESNPWNYWRERFYRGERVPVFFIRDGDRVAVGLSSMFRLAYRHSVHEAIRNSSAAHLENRGDDLPALLFGFTDEEQGKRSLKGRVWFEHAFALGNPRPQAQEPTVLSSPKPSFFPAYIQQPDPSLQTGVLPEGEPYTTLMDDDAEIRGYKRYPARQEVRFPELDEKVRRNRKVQIVLHPLPAGTKFEGKVHFHNLKPEELGALLWALSWGGNARLRHGIGMGKPLGMGQGVFRVLRAELFWNDPEKGAEDLRGSEWEKRMQELIERFEAMMQAFDAEWRNSPQLRQLCAMADPDKAAQAPGGRLEPMPLDRYRQAKNQRLVLQAYPASNERR